MAFTSRLLGVDRIVVDDRDQERLGLMPMFEDLPPQRARQLVSDGKEPIDDARHVFHALQHGRARSGAVAVEMLARALGQKIVDLRFRLAREGYAGSRTAQRAGSRSRYPARDPSTTDGPRRARSRDIVVVTRLWWRKGW